MKTINLLKKGFISAIVLTMVMGFAFGFNVIVKAAPEIGFIDGLNIEGAGIRTNGNQGMRFKVTIDSSVDKTEITKYGVAIAYGLVEDPSKFYYNQKVNGKDIISGSVTQLDGDNCYYITLYNIPQTGYMQNISVRAFYGNMYGYAYGNDIKVYNLATIAYKAMNDGITSSLLTDVDTYMNANYKKVYVDEFENLVFDGFRETNPIVLKEQFINDINQYTNTTLTIDSSVSNWVTQLQYNTDITDSNLYQAYKNTKFNNKWSWLFDYLENYGHIKTNQQVSRLDDNVVPGTNYNNLKNLIYSLYNFFNYDSLDNIDSIPFYTESAYSTLTTSNIYPEIANYDIRKNGTSSALGHEDGILGYTVNKWKINSTEYLTTATYTTPSSNKKLTCSNKTCHVKYNIDQSEITITGLNVNVSDLVILSEYEGYPTNIIQNNAFNECGSIKSLTIQNGVVSIGEKSFYWCSNLTSVSIPASVSYINDDAFKQCSSLASIIINPDNAVYDSRDNCNAIIETAANTLIQGCNNTTIPNTVTIINTFAFLYCMDLKSITIPDSVTQMGDNAFYSCSSLESVTVGSGLNSIGDSAFMKCNNLKNVTLGNSVVSIGSSAFEECTSLTSITLSNTLTSIGNYAFYNCSSLTSITIPSTVTTMGMGVFENCSKLVIYANFASKPSGWNANWNPSNRTVYWIS